jgi:hypothetical protein
MKATYSDGLSTLAPYAGRMASNCLRRACMKSASCQSPPERTPRFGEPSVWAESRLPEAPPEQLELWSERLLEADRLEEVFEASGGH